MGTLKTTLKVESTDLFPTPVSFTVVNNNGINGNFNGFNTVTLTATPSVLNASLIDGTGAYLYAQSPSTNTSPISIGYSGQTAGGLTGNTASFVYMTPGDVAFVPIGVGATCASIIATSVGAGTSATLNFFIGEK